MFALSQETIFDISGSNSSITASHFWHFSCNGPLVPPRILRMPSYVCDLNVRPPESVHDHGIHDEKINGRVKFLDQDANLGLKCLVKGR